MKKAKYVSVEKSQMMARPRSLRRWARQMFSNLIKRQGGGDPHRMKEILNRLEEIKESLESISREIARHMFHGGRI